MSIAAAFSYNTSLFRPSLARDEAPQWTLRVSGSVDPSPMPVHERDLVPVLAHLLRDERVQDIVVVRRARELHAHVARVPAAVLKHGTLAVDVVARDVRADGARVHLTRREHDLLVYLLQNPDRAIPRGELLENVWQTTRPESMRTVDIHMRRLRAKLSHIGFPLETLVGVGYRFTTQVVGGELAEREDVSERGQED